MPTPPHTRARMSLRRLTSAFVVALVMALGVTAANFAPASAAGDWTRVAKTSEGKMRSKIVGSTANGGSVTGSYTPTKFITRNGKVFVRGFLEGVVKHPSGRTEQFSGVERMRVKKINGQDITTARQARAAAAANCDVLNLVLGPLDLDLLGLVVHLDRVVLNIIAASGAGNLLGNLLCAVAGLLDGGLGGLLGRLGNLLNRILGLLNLGL